MIAHGLPIYGMRCIDPTLKAPCTLGTVQRCRSLPPGAGHWGARRYGGAAARGGARGRADSSGYALGAATNSTASRSGGGTSKAEIGVASSVGLSRG
jgi:hypothetical protein